MPKIFSLSPKKDGQPMTETEAETFAAQLKSALDEASSQVCGQH